MSAPLVSTEVTESFRAQGFAVVPDLLTAAELERFGAAVTRAVIERKQSDRRSLAEKSRYEQSFIQCQNLWEDHPAVRPLDFHARVGQAAAELLGVERVRLWHDQALYKEPGGRETDPHQDHPYWPIEEPLTVTAWIPFEGGRARLRRGTGRRRRLPPRAHCPPGQAEPHRLPTGGAHRDLLRRRLPPPRRQAVAPVSRSAGDPAWWRHRQRGHADRVATAAR